MITGLHAILFSPGPDEVRAFLRDVLGFDSVDAGGGWLIFAAPPAELAAHPADGGAAHHELYLMCDDIEATVAELRAKGVEVVRPVTDERWGLLTAIALPGGGELGLYEPRHPTAIASSQACPVR
jgi:catechol 2,3-dioxygenase-like lactoylglutathione lyase family enzyme